MHDVVEIAPTRSGQMPASRNIVFISSRLSKVVMFTSSVESEEAREAEQATGGPAAVANYPTWRRG
jgi:hypothetical protein